jgi:hypothetical protein
MLAPEHSFLGTLALVFLAIAIVFSFDTFIAKLERTEDQAEARRLFADGQRLQGNPFSGPLGPGRRRRLGENSKRYFRFLRTWWRCSRVAGFNTMAERKRRDGRMKRVHKPSKSLSVARRFGAHLRPRFKNQQLMPEKHGFCNHPTYSARPSQSGHRDNQVNQKDQAVAHYRQWYQSVKLPNRMRFSNSPWTPT